MPIPTRELWRKSIHFSGVFFLPILLWRREIFTALLLVFLAVYLFEEFLNRRGVRIPLITMITERSKRPSEQGRLSRGALCLVSSAIIAPYLFGPGAAALALAQTFVADTISAFVGMQWGTRKLPYSRSKSWVGSITFLATAFLLGLYFVPWPKALLLAAVGAFVESLPIPEMDNLSVPLTTGFIATIMKIGNKI